MEHPCVVGYKGEIGSFILNGLLKVMPKALDIWCVDVNETEEEVAKRLEVSDVIFLCVPMDKTVEWILKHKAQLMDKVIIEQCSLKEWIYEVEELKDLDIRSMHILFRPSQTPNPEDRQIAFFRGQMKPLTLAGKILEMLQSQGVLYTNATHHDREMAIQQALLHRTLLVMGKMLKECKGSTYISKRVLELDERIRKGNKELYGKIQKNRHLPKQLERMKKEFDEFDVDKYWKKRGVGMKNKILECRCGKYKKEMTDVQIDDYDDGVMDMLKCPECDKILLPLLKAFPVPKIMEKV